MASIDEWTWSADPNVGPKVGRASPTPHRKAWVVPRITTAWGVGRASATVSGSTPVAGP
ncbi:hypothetical protein ACEZDB_38445 [Streptacidiphilus sp. N1-3]|uniref:Uncharacterized protein n=1 Tax=Streptacidiphilus alkalitolerans TaxID=3342712 RepID=A0ABV6XF27_9ACTN